MFSDKYKSLFIGFLVAIGCLYTVFGVSKSVSSQFSVRLKDYFYYCESVFTVGGRQSVIDSYIDTLSDVAYSWRDIDSVGTALQAVFFSFITPFRLTINTLNLLVNLVIVLLKFFVVVIFGGSL